MFISVVLALLCIILVYLLIRTFQKSDDLKGISGPSISDLLAILYSNKDHLTNPFKLLYSIHDRYGPTCLIHMKPFSPIVITSDHNYFGEILASKEYLDKSSVYDVYQQFVGESIILTKNIDVWKNDRRIMNEAFGHESFKLFLEHLDEKLHKLEAVIIEKMDAPVDMQDIFHKFILHSTIDSLKDPIIEWDPDRTNAYKKAADSFLSDVFKRVLVMTFKLDILYKMTKNYKAIANDLKAIKQYAKDMVDAHLKVIEQIDTNNIIYRLYKADVPYDRIVDNVELFIEGAHETVATSLAYLVFEIAKYPDVQKKIRDEIDGVVGNDQNAPISTADIQQMKYLHCVVKEGLRIHTSVSYVMRTLKKRAVVNNVTLPKGTNIVFFIDALQKSEKYYKDPLVFNPDRFSDENQSDLIPNTWTPFSLGIRNCIGKSLAMQKMKLILVKLVRRFEFSPVMPEHVLDIKGVIITRSVNGTLVRIKLRDSIKV